MLVASILSPALATWILPAFCALFRGTGLGVTMIKPTASYFLFLITFRHNQICGLAVAFKNIFWGSSCASKKIYEMEVSWESCAKPAKMPIM